MRFEDLSLSGAKLIHGAPAVDNRGYFERILSAAALKDAGIIAQKGTPADEDVMYVEQGP